MKCKVLKKGSGWLPVILTLPVWVCSLAAQAQTGKLFSADDLLPSSFINQVYLDRDGVVWGVTRNGLARYDGYQAQIFKKERGAGLASNYVNCMAQDGRGLFYFGMYGALQTWDGNAFRDVVAYDLSGEAVPCYVTSIVCLSSGEVVAGTSGHGLLTVASPTEARQVGGELATLHTVQRMMEDSRGRLWLVTDGQGLLVWADGRVVERYFYQPGGHISVNRLCEDREGRIYVGTAGDGVVRLEPSADGGQGAAFTPVAATAGRKVTALCTTRDGRILIGYDGQGLAILEPQTGMVTDNPYYSGEVDLSLAKVSSIVEDGAGNVWIGMLQKGIYMQPARAGDFHYMGYKMGTRNTIGQACVTSTLLDSQGRTWVGTDKDGLYLLDRDGQPLRHYAQQFPQTVLTLMEDSRGRIWLGSFKEGCGWIGADGTYHRQPLPQGADASVFGLAEDARGRIWMGTMGGGLACLAPDGTTTTSATQEGAVGNRQVNSLTNDYITKLSASPDGRRIYVSTTMGVCCLDTEGDSWTSLFGGNCLNYGTAARVAKEYDGRLWVGTNDGLLCYDLKERTLRPVEGLVGVASLERDGQGRLWAGTDHGLCCHDPATGQTESYFVDNGLQANEFSDGASSVSADGLMLFGGVGGITWFDPQCIRRPEWEAEVKLVGFILNGQPVSRLTRSGGYQVCDTTVTAANRFQLAYHENHFAIRLSTLSYDNPEHITYLYSINGEPYISLQRGVNEITFTHLAPGTYHFSIKAERNNQQTAERRFTVVVHAPWYRTWWAYGIWLALLGLAVWQMVRLRRRKEQNRLRLQEHIHAEEMADAKLKFFMNISHEIRTPMTLILAPLNSLIKAEGDPQRRSVYETMRRNAERILNLINQMMDLRKIDKGMMQMHMQQTDLVAFVADIHSLFEHQARARRIRFAFEHADAELPVWVDRQQFDKVIVNILSNAFKFTPADGEIVIRVGRNGGQAEIAVSDSGEHIPEDKLERIFERFYQSPSETNRQKAGTGIGLDLARSLVELHDGTITAHNLEQGCEFVVSIPLGSDHLTAEEICQTPDPEATAAEEEGSDGEVAEVDMLASTSVGRRETAGGRPSIVVAEDDDEIRTYLEAELKADFDVRACSNGREALAEVLRRLPDLVLSDVMMPEMDGNALCATLKTNPQTGHIPVVLLTAKGSDDDQLAGLGTGADAYLVKPFNMDILRHTIINFIHSRRQLRLKYGRNDQLEEQVEQIAMKSPDDKLLDRVMKVINQNLANSDLSVDSIATEVGISRVHLHRKMKELTGQTPHDFIRNLRLKQAAHLLATGDRNVTEVVYACGFGNVTSFSTTFKRFYGMSPREYMQEHQKGGGKTARKA